MEELKCSGTNALTGEEVSLKGGTTISHLGVTPIGVSQASRNSTRFIAPGFVDIQVNGFAGVDYNSGLTSQEELARSIQVLFSTGVSRFFPTVITGSPHGMVDALKNLTRAKETLTEGIAIEGFHVEGPHISAEDGPRGAHPRQCFGPNPQLGFARIRPAQVADDVRRDRQNKFNTLAVVEVT